MYFVYVKYHFIKFCLSFYAIDFLYINTFIRKILPFFKNLLTCFSDKNIITYLAYVSNLFLTQVIYASQSSWRQNEKQYFFFGKYIIKKPKLCQIWLTWNILIKMVADFSFFSLLLLLRQELLLFAIVFNKDKRMFQTK